MAEQEPSLLRADSANESVPSASDDAERTEPTAAKAEAIEPKTAARSEARSESKVSTPSARDSRRPAQVVHVVGFWKRALAATVDLAVVIPTALLVTWLASKISGVQLPSGNIKLFDIDLWIDLILATDPAIVMGLVLFFAVALAYLFVFHIAQGRTLGMRLLRLRIIDLYGDRPSPARCAARCAGYLAGVATLFLGFLWMGFDSEKRGLQDWLAGTLVIRADR